MGLGTKIRLSRLFSNPSGNLFAGAVDHFVGYGNVREGGLADLFRSWCFTWSPSATSWRA